jgi:hypothetical protein
MNRRLLQGLTALTLAATALVASGESLRTAMIRFSTLKLIDKPSIALKHLTLEGLNLDADYIEVDLSCNVTRQTGALDCTRGPQEFSDAQYVIAAIRRSRAMKLDPSQFKSDDPAVLRTNLTVKLASAERRPIDFVGAPKLALGELQWAATPSADEVAAAYPAELLHQGLSATVNLVCQVQIDRSVICATVDPAPAPQFSWAGKAVMSLYVAAPTLKSGGPSAGTVFATKVDFKP